MSKHSIAMPKVCIKEKRVEGENFLLYTYGKEKTNHIDIGDYFQTIATQHAISTVLQGAEFSYVHRDTVYEYEGEPAFVLMQGAFEDNLGFLPNNKVHAIWVGTHLGKSIQDSIVTEEQNSVEWREYFRTREVGCRDFYTYYFFRMQEVPCYFSRCLTLTLPTREVHNSQKHVYMVDVPLSYYPHIPNSIKDNAIIREKGGSIHSSGIWEKDIEEAQKVLQEYMNRASLMLTSHLHTALVCIAMGIPVVLIKDTYDSARRFGALYNLIPMNTLEDFEAGIVNFSPKAPVIEELKSLMLQNVLLSYIRCREGVYQEEYSVETIRSAISNFSTME